LRFVAALAAAGVLVSACSSTGYHYVKSSEDRNYFKVPEDWKLYDEDVLIGRLDLSPREEEIERETAWRVGFDAHPKPAVRHIEQLLPSHPIGQGLVLQLDQDSSDSISTETLRNIFFPIDEALQQNTGTAVFYDTLELDGGFHGIHLVGEIDDPESGRALVFNQKVVVDQSTSTLYALVIRCESRCYEKNEDKIDLVMKSWTVRE
jgi:hypothetical protein